MIDSIVHRAAKALYDTDHANTDVQPYEQIGARLREAYETAARNVIEVIEVTAIDRERIAQLIAHRACCGSEHDPQVGKLHGFCIVCGVPWPCDYAGVPPKGVIK